MVGGGPQFGDAHARLMLGVEGLGGVGRFKLRFELGGTAVIAGAWFVVY